MSDKPPLREVLSYYGVELHSQRREQQVMCPAHDEDRPSCSVNEDSQVWNCHACGAGGDSLTLIMLKENCDFRAALTHAEAITGGSYSGVPGSARRGGARVPRGKGFAPRFRGASVRPRPLSSS